MKKFLDLGLQPLANKYLTKKDLVNKKKEQLYHLEVGFDNKTKLVSILNKVSSNKMFDNNYPYRSSMSKTMVDSFKRLSKKIIKDYKPKLILEIGSNDGSLIQNFNKKKVICVEPCKNLAKLTSNINYTTYSEYWSSKLAKKITRNKKADLIYSANTLSHIKNLNEIFRAINYSLSEKGILILEDPSLLKCIKNVAYDQFYCEHIYVFSTISLKNILNNFDLEIFDVQNTTTHGGSNRYFIKKKINKSLNIKKSVKTEIKKELKFGLNKITTYRVFANKVKKSKIKLLNIFQKIKKKELSVIGYGATAKSCTILNYCKIGNKFIDYFYDTTSYKINRYLPGSKILIKKYKKLNKKNIDIVFLGAWNFKDEIFKKEKNFIKKGGKFIIHVPTPKII